jgi:hypothetical protein
VAPSEMKGMEKDEKIEENDVQNKEVVEHDNGLKHRSLF